MRCNEAYGVYALEDVTYNNVELSLIILYPLAGAGTVDSKGCSQKFLDGSRALITVGVKGKGLIIVIERGSIGGPISMASMTYSVILGKGVRNRRSSTEAAKLDCTASMI